MTWKVFDCANSHPTCDAHNQTIDANPDIAGVGVVISFLMTTCLAFLIAFTVIFLDRYESIINLYRRFVSKKGGANYEQNYNGPYWRSTAFWSRVLSKNLLAFSDTQLLTGLAIQFTGLLKHCNMRVYHWKIVTELAFLTTVTHLLTVVALRNYFVKYRWINLPRIFFMLANLGLLGYTSYISYSYEFAGLDISTELSCFFQGQRPKVKSAFGTKWTGLLVGAIGGHVTVILAMYFLKEPEEGGKKEWYYWLGAAFRTWIVAPIYGIYGLYMAGDGLRYTQALGTPNVRMNGSESEWNFGQFLPVLLLALPLFAGWESFWEEKDEDRENRFGRGSRWTWEKGRNSQMDGLDVPPEKVRVEESRASLEERTVESSGIQTPRPVVMATHRSSTPRLAQ
ncbi:hypothetical protein HBI56_126350 [Parastagonospora nodorum]|nr:hypothetical protein HBH52_012480 [Parastagonospora nodorum]KAH4056899.1 hypothetical protein HBH49_038840 [Parastagonospora nodorum]KAH4110193.1 hypothetical protein HBH46_022320 [Parastagonospora nodorum]KAH4118552.1 hypothetical protein HBH47_136000 [Parastagonospora nodorum]KAH4221653.1 hypothetical protein HBI06_156510 [Parastagonospora nodorum]